MDNQPNSDQNTPTSIRPDMSSIYPTPLSNAEADVITQAPTQLVPTTATVSGESPRNNLSVVFGILLLLTFFTPLGAILFLPMLLTGFMLAFRTIGKREDSFKAVGENKTNPIITAIKALVMVAIVIVVGIIGLIALLFIGVASGAVDFRMGS